MVDNLSGYAIYTVYRSVAMMGQYIWISGSGYMRSTLYTILYVRTLYISVAMVDNISGYMRYTQLANFSARLHWGVALSVTCTNGSLLTDQGKGLQYRCPAVSSQLVLGQLGQPNN